MVIRCEMEKARRIQMAGKKNVLFFFIVFFLIRVNFSKIS